MKVHIMSPHVLLKIWVYEYGLDRGVVVAETLEDALGELCFSNEHDLLMAELPQGRYHAALLPEEYESPRWVELSEEGRPELKFATIEDR